MKNSITKWLIILSVGCFSLLAQAQSESFITATVKAPHQLSATISINKIYGINTIDQTYEVDGYLVTSWQDETITVKPETGRRIYENQRIDKIIDDGVWIPAFEFINIIGQRLTANRRLIVSSTGEITYNERFQGTFTTEMDFRRFPFDHQTFDIIMEPFSYDQNTLIFDKVHAFLEEPKNKSLSEWDIQNKPKAETSQSIYSHLDNQQSTIFSRLTVSIEAERKPYYYIWQFILPLSLILAASWSVFWITGFAERLSTAFTMMLTVVAYTFFTSSILPKLPYTTFIERMIIMGYLSIFASILVIVFVMLRERKGYVMDKLIYHCRYLFPCTFLIAIAVLIGINNHL